MARNNDAMNNSDVASLQEQCRALQQALEEKDESMFELSATLATVEAEAKHQVKQVQKETSAKIQKYQEALRRTEREATLLHHQLSHVTNGGSNNAAVQQQRPPTAAAAPVVPSTTNAPAAAAAAAPTSLTISQQPQSSLALHLLQSCGARSESPPNVIMVAATSDKTTNDISLVWQLTEHCLLHDTGWTWWKLAITKSAAARNMIRCSLCNTTSCSSSRIVCTGISQEELQQIADSTLYNTTTTPSSPYLQDLCQRLWDKITCDCQHLDLVALVLVDASPQECEGLGWQRLCVSLTSPIPVLLRTCAKTYFATPPIPSGLRLQYNDIDVDNATMDESTLCLALDVMRQCWSFGGQDKEWARHIMGVLLDFLEFYVLVQVEKHVPLACSILQVLQRWCLAPEGVVLLQTQFGLSVEKKKWACTGIGVVVLLWSRVMMESNNNTATIGAECVRLLHLVLQHVRRQRERCEQDKKDEPCSFRSLLVEYAEAHKAACNNMLLDEENMPESLRKLAAMQLHEIALDEEDLEDVRREMAAAHAMK